MQDNRKEHNERLRRVTRMEEIYDRSCTAVEEVLLAVQRYLELENEFRELEEYYQSATWLEDMDADRRGEIPENVKRGILSEDAIYDLMTQKDSMLRLMGQVKNDE